VNEVNDPLAVLQKYYGYSSFRPGQRELIEAAVSGRDVLGVLPTGGGKSICYQIPALLLPGLCIVISPLISLMHDQVMHLQKRHIKAACITSELKRPELLSVLHLAERGVLKLLYVSPERLTTKDFAAFSKKADISLLVVDEAHSISMWGHEFRPSYLHIRDYIDSLPARPVTAAYTATAAPRVREEIRTSLGLKDPFEYTASFDRPNLYYEVRHTADKRAALLSLLPAYKGFSGIVYCLTRRSATALTRYLNAEGIPAVCYHAGMSAKDRQQHQELWMQGDVPVIVATNAFGMGIDKPDVRFVIHYQMPGSPEHYYQEAGRAGRDGKRSDCILLYSDRDLKANRFFINRTRSAVLRAAMEQQLDAMRRYAGGHSCLRRYLLAYFGEIPSSDTAGDSCHSCSVCLRFNLIPKALPAGTEDHALYRSLVSVRSRLSAKHHVLPYKILSDAALHDLASLRPESFFDFLLMEHTPFFKGIKYGADFLTEIRAWNASH
jgi:ATP-dependent DNA helicase RecQ